jgi:Na+/proline symporter
MELIAAHWPVLLCLLVYLAACFAIGWHFSQRASRGVADFYIAKRSVPGWVVSLAFFSTFASTNTYIGQAGQAFASGLSWAWVGVLWTVFCMVSWLLLGPRLRNQTVGLKSVTVPDYFDFRYRSPLSRPTRVLSALTILFATLWYMAGIAKGCAHLLETVLGVPYGWGVVAILGFTCVYTVMGGMYSVLWTDALQGVMMLLVAVVMAAIPFVYAGGVRPLFERISQTSHVTAAGAPIGDGLVTFGTLVSVTYIIGIGLSVGMKQIAEPRCLVRFYSIDSASGMRFAMIWTPVFLGVSLVCVMGLGALVHGMATDQEAAALITNTDQVVGFMLAKFDNTAVSAFCITGLFAAGMSSLASVMLIVGTAAVGDIRNLWVRSDPASTVRWTRAAIVAYSGIVALVTLFPPAGVVELTSFSGAVFAAGFFPAVFGGLYLRWGTGHGAFWSMLAGMAATLAWRFGVRFHVERLQDVHEIIPAFCLSLAVYVVVSRMTHRHQPPEDHLARVFGD